MGRWHFLGSNPHRDVLIRQGVKFALVGVTNTLVCLGTIFVLSSIPGVSYKAANVAGYILGLINSFVLNRIWTFRSTDRILPQFVRFLLVFAVCYGIQFGALVTLVELIHLGTTLSQVLAMVFYTAVNFVLNRTAVYRQTRRM